MAENPTHTPHNAASEKWTEIELLPDWDEEFYDIYTAKKYGKWLMLKTLKKQYRDVPEYQEMIEKEFDIRYNLAHPHIVMINDFEEVPGIGMCIITDDVYGDSLRKLINENRVTKAHIDKLRNQLVDAMEYIQTEHITHHPIRPEGIIFTENIGNLKLIDVGFDQKNHLTQVDTAEDICNYGKTVLEALDHSDYQDTELRKIAKRCCSQDSRNRFRTVQDLHLALSNRKNRHLLLWIMAFIVAMIAILWFSTRYYNAHEDQYEHPAVEEFSLPVDGGGSEISTIE